MHKFKIIGITFFIVLIVLVLTYVLLPQDKSIKHYPLVENAFEAVPDFSSISNVVEKKQAFFEYLAPAVEAQNSYILELRQVVQGYKSLIVAGESLSSLQQDNLNWLYEEYRINLEQSHEQRFAELLRKIDIIPLELVLVQSANESAWGTSRFARDGYNFFGLWCFKKGCGFVPKRRNEGATHEVAKFDDLSSAMYSYMRNINRHDAYKELRLIRHKRRNNQQNISAIALIDGLSKYSERGQEYIEELLQMIKVNKDLIPS
ncbi:glucosaminidase domain-containing protein [Glaciecola petra]|uniref:Glucosaminidase domain-containing protein n=1 Tax=Glaciecola petra TaxID=3075602 RepID=A0ABU2ZPC8_9ALTE|nr:glucosaminidase domain-containing protein [Aestuariibacter sp. P117]MDT0594260.1 glucosaminidase domain-containing protein [Aestuariibacter sp. P117]